MTFPANLRRLRKQAGLTQEQLALRAGFPGQSRVANYENGTREPAFDDLRILAMALGTDEASLIGNGQISRTVAENDIIAIQIAMRSLVKALAENVPAAGRTFCAHVREQAAEIGFSPRKKLLGHLLGIVEPDRSAEEDEDLPEPPRRSRARNKR